jgi:group I intron endonuclease
LPEVSGIYVIRNTINGKVYVGSAINLRQRWSVHLKMLRQGVHHSPLLQRSWTKYGPDAFVFEVIEHVSDRKDLIAREQHWIDTLKSTDPARGFNAYPIAGSPLGSRRSAEQRALMSSSRKGRKLPPFSAEHRAAISASKKGTKASDETRAKMSAQRKGKTIAPFTESHRSAISAGKKGKKVPKISAARLGTKASDATRKRFSETRRGKKLGPFTEKHRANIGRAKRGKKMMLSEERRNELRALTIARNRRRSTGDLKDQFALPF